jgi:transposase-like protein
MDLSRAVYSRDLKITAMRALDAGARTGEIARKYQLSPKLLERWRGEWRARGEAAFPGIGRRGAVCRRWTMPAASPIWSAKSAS